MSGLGALTKTVKAAKKAEPFYSAVDEAAKGLARGKGTGKEFMTELIKVKGVKPTEIKERGLQKIEAMPKMTKEEFLQKLEENPAPKFEEKVLSTPSEREIEERAYELAHQESREMAKIRGYRGGDVDDVADEMAEDIMSGSDREEYMQRAQEALYDDGYTAQHGEYTLPGGENYREILLKVPGFKDQQKLMELEAMRRRVDPKYHSNRYEELTKQIDELKAKKAAMPEQFEGVDMHFKGEPGILASIRVSDRITPTYTKKQAEEIGQRIAESFGVADHKNLGNGSIDRAIKTGVVTPKEAAQYADFRGFKDVDTTGAKQKVLHIEEIQSDWHQEGRKQGYKTGKEEQDYVDYLKELETKAKDEAKQDFISEGVAEDRAEVLADRMAKRLAEDPRHLTSYFGADSEARRVELHQARMNARNAVPDAPFKKNWHELALKRMLNYAAENGYDRVAITPGVEQASRYNLAKQVEQITATQEDGKFRLFARDLQGKNHDMGAFEPEKLPEVVGKDLANKIASQEKPYDIYQGVDLEVGGEGMKGFYDQMIPSYLNTYGKKYGVQVSPMDIITHPEKSIPQIAAPGIGHFPEPIIEPAKTVQVHGFDITPEMREEITGKGLPLYQQIGIPAGGAAAGAEALQQDEQGFAVGGPVGSSYDTTPDMQDGGQVLQGTAFKRGGKVKNRRRVTIADNPDTMWLELMSKS